ncbi:MAG: glycosyltransferase family 4 protein [Muribaculaceae bacterium]|nr:glycosyltransferase family 4 protein [Muribaculaceae bacterium]
MDYQKKVLFVANNKGFTNFNAPYMNWFKSQGWIVDNATPGRMSIETGLVDHHFDIDITASPFSLKNFSAYRQLKRLIDEGNYDIVHVHTPMGAVLGRLASIKAQKKGTKVIYTAHGFHFFKGAPLKNWLMYYPIERLLARFNDCLVTINDEDYEFSRRKKLSRGGIFHIDGVGVNMDRFAPVGENERLQLREKYGLKKDDFVALFIGRPTHDKNHKMLLKALPDIIKEVPNIKVLCAGEGELRKECMNLAAESGISQHIEFLGPRADIPDLCRVADIHISTSLREGLAVGNIEAMATGCALVVSDIRGHREVCKDRRNGFLFPLDRPDILIDSIIRLAHDRNLLSKISATNIEDARMFSIDKEVERMAEIYRKVMETAVEK